MTEIEIGRLLRASTTACVVGCRVSQANAPAFGGLVRIPLDPDYSIYGLIYDIHIDGRWAGAPAGHRGTGGRRRDSG